MVKVRPADIPLSLLLAVALLALVAVHTIAYATAHGLGAGYAAAMSMSGHDAYWTLFILGVLVTAALAAIAARSRTRFTRVPGGAKPGTYIGLLARVWVTLALASLAGFVVLENLEAALHEGSMVGLAPVALVGRLADLGPAAVAITGLALGVIAVVFVGRVDYATVLNRSYADLVAGGVYTAGFRQSPWAVRFVGDVIRPLLADRSSGTPVRILESGCGTGVWLEELATIASDVPAGAALFGFDLSPDMVAAARSRLERAGVQAEVREGDVLDPSAYAFAGDDEFDLVMAYDVVQQLPAAVQLAAVDAMLAHVTSGGTLVIFDHDAKSRYGRIMGTKKWLRRYLGIPLVPRHYIHARYPDLEVLRRRAVKSGRTAEIAVEAEGRKRALIVGARDGNAGMAPTPARAR